MQLTKLNWARIVALKKKAAIASVGWERQGFRKRVDPYVTFTGWSAFTNAIPKSTTNFKICSVKTKRLTVVQFGTYRHGTDENTCSMFYPN